VRLFSRYLLWQVPGWLAVAAALAALHWLTGLPGWIVPAGLAAFVGKDLAMYPVVRDTLREPRPRLEHDQVGGLVPEHLAWGQGSVG